MVEEEPSWSFYGHHLVEASPLFQFRFYFLKIQSVAQEDLRCKAVKAVLESKKQVEIAKIFGVTRQAVGKWVKAYREGGTRILKAVSINKGIISVSALRCDCIANLHNVATFIY